MFCKKFVHAEMLHSSDFNYFQKRKTHKIEKKLVAGALRRNSMKIFSHILNHLFGVFCSELKYVSKICGLHFEIVAVKSIH